MKAALLGIGVFGLCGLLAGLWIREFSTLINDHDTRVISTTALDFFFGIVSGAGAMMAYHWARGRGW